MVISRYGLDVKHFDNDSNVWAESEICNWLNVDFYNTAFDETEKSFIKPVNIVDDSYDFSGSDYNVFLLSKAEVENTEYFANADARRCEATAYAVKNVAYVASNGYSYWWLRSPSLDFSPNPDFSNRVYFVNIDGLIYEYDVYFDYSLVRPALWINL